MYIYKEDLALNNRQELICYKPQPSQQNKSFLLTSETTVQLLIISNCYLSKFDNSEEI